MNGASAGPLDQGFLTFTHALRFVGQGPTVRKAGEKELSPRRALTVMAGLDPAIYAPSVLQRITAPTGVDGRDMTGRNIGGSFPHIARNRSSADHRFNGIAPNSVWTV